MSPRVAALYVDERGPYVGRPDVDAWPESRDARLYDGPLPVVAHPPCGPWGKLAPWCTKQDASCGPRALEQVRRWGGVLEHPAGSKLLRLIADEGAGYGQLDMHGGYLVRVDQVWWGHKCRKPTVLYVVRTSLDMSGADYGAQPTHIIRAKRGDPRSNPLTASAAIRRRTPPAFLEMLVDAAARATPR